MYSIRLHPFLLSKHPFLIWILSIHVFRTSAFPNQIPEQCIAEKLLMRRQWLSRTCWKFNNVWLHNLQNVCKILSFSTSGHREQIKSCGTLSKNHLPGDGLGTAPDIFSVAHLYRCTFLASPGICLFVFFGYVSNRKWSLRNCTD